MRYEQIASQAALEDFCRELAAAPVIALDTEFVAEDVYRPELCLVQVAALGKLAVIDPFSVEDLSLFWRAVAAPGSQTVVHAGRQEFCFCRQAVGRRPAGWFDVQIAAGFVGLEYPAAYTTLVSRLLGKTLHKSETRTNWRRRPLSRRQLEYALEDVVWLQPLRDALMERIDRLGRRRWLEQELEAWQEQVEREDGGEQWRRVSGLSGLSPRSLAVARALWRWREGEAERRNCPPRRVLRDDLIVELARRQTADVRRIRAVRGLQRRNLQRHLPQIARCVQQALALPESACPAVRPAHKKDMPQVQALAQFLHMALACVCRQQELAPSLVGTMQDMRELVAYQLGLEQGRRPPPALLRGWRTEVAGKLIDDLLAGNIWVRVGPDPLSQQPLVFQRRRSRGDGAQSPKGGEKSS